MATPLRKCKTKNKEGRIIWNLLRERLRTGGGWERVKKKRGPKRGGKKLRDHEDRRERINQGTGNRGRKQGERFKKPLFVKKEKIKGIPMTEMKASLLST